MPEQNDNDRPAPPALPVVQQDAREEKQEQVKLPPTEAERRKARLEKAEKESDDERSERRTKELRVHFDAHMENVKEAHANYPAPLTRNFEEWTFDEQRNWNERSKVIASANKAYHLAVKRTFAEHVTEDNHVKRVRDAAKKAQENA